MYNRDRDGSEPIPVMQRKASSGQSWRMSPEDKPGGRDTGRWRSESVSSRSSRLGDGRTMGQPRSWESADGYEEHHKRRSESNGYRDGSRDVRRESGGGHQNQHPRNRGEERSRSDATDNWRDAQPSQQQQQHLQSRRPHDRGERRDANGGGSFRPAWADADVKSDGDVPESRMKNIFEHERLEEQRRRAGEARDTVTMDEAKKKEEGAALGTESMASSTATRKGSADHHHHQQQQQPPSSAGARGSRFANLFEKSSTVLGADGAAAATAAPMPAGNADASATILNLLQGNGGAAVYGGGGGVGPDRPAISASEIEKAMMATVSTGQHQQHPQQQALAQQAHVQRDAVASQQLMAMLQLGGGGGGGGGGGPESNQGPGEDMYTRGPEQQGRFAPPVHPSPDSGPSSAQQQQQQQYYHQQQQQQQQQQQHQQQHPPGSQHGLMYQAPPFGHAPVFAPGMYMPMPGMPPPGMGMGMPPPPPPHMVSGGQMQHFSGMPSPPPPGMYQSSVQGGMPPPHPAMMAAQQPYGDHFYPPPPNNDGGGVQ